MIRGAWRPCARAAVTNSRSAKVSVLARAIRAKAGIDTMAMAMHTLSEAARREGHDGDGRTSAGKASRMSTQRHQHASRSCPGRSRRSGRSMPPMSMPMAIDDEADVSDTRGRPR